MKTDCRVIEDLIPLYLDGVCSVQTKELVEEHLGGCENCRKLIEQVHPVNMIAPAGEDAVTDRTVKKAFKKIRLRWILSVVAALASIPIMILGFNQYRDAGVHFTNLRELHIGSIFIKHLEAGDYQKAYDCINIKALQQEWTETWFDESKLESIEEDGREIFCRYGCQLEEAGGINEHKYVGVSLCGYRGSKPLYRIVYSVKYDKTDTLFNIVVSDDGVEHFGGGGSFVSDPLAQFAIWSEYLWQNYEGCYFDTKAKTYVYYPKE